MATHGDLRQRAHEAALRLIDASGTGETDGEAIARELGLGLGSEGNQSALYHALFALKDEGRLRCDFPGGMQLPYRVRR